jgi:hypothetical protein
LGSTKTHSIRVGAGFLGDFAFTGWPALPSVRSRIAVAAVIREALLPSPFITPAKTSSASAARTSAFARAAVFRAPFGRPSSLRRQR